MSRHRIIAVALFGAANVLACQAHADEPAQGKRLTQAMGFGEVSQGSVDICNENMAGHDVEKSVEATPGLLGGIRPGDADWPEARALYIDMLKAGCDYDRPLAEETFARALETSLSPADIDALVAFYAGELGGKYRAASQVANNDAYRVMKPLIEADVSYAEFEKKLQALLERRPMPAAAARDLGTVAALATPDEAVALSDRMMQGVVAGRVREALALGVPHAVLTEAQIDSVIAQFEQQQEVIATRYGGSVGYELLRNDMVGGSLQRTVFLHRLDRHAMVWLFIWYRGRDGWVLNDLSYVDNPAILFN